MDNFTVIYKILKALEEAMDYEEPDLKAISAENLKISASRLDALLEMMSDEGYIKGVTIFKSIGGKSVRHDKIRITLKGLEYFDEDKFIKKASNAMKGTVE